MSRASPPSQKYPSTSSQARLMLALQCACAFSCCCWTTLSTVHIVFFIYCCSIFENACVLAGKKVLRTRKKAGNLNEQKQKVLMIHPLPNVFLIQQISSPHVKKPSLSVKITLPQEYLVFS
jgi:hypothetical protein